MSSESVSLLTLLEERSDLFLHVLLQLPVVDAWRLQGVSRSWRAVLGTGAQQHGGQFWKLYCAQRGWDHRAFAAKYAKREARVRERLDTSGRLKRKFFVPGAPVNVNVNVNNMNLNINVNVNKDAPSLTLAPPCAPSAVCAFDCASLNSDSDTDGEALLVRSFARRRFFKEERRRMFQQARPEAAAAFKDPELLRSYGSDMLGFLTHVLTLDPLFCPALNKRALVYFDEGKYDLAVKDLELCLAHFPYFSDGINNLGLAYHEMGNYEAALTLYTRSLAMEGDGVTFNNRGLCYNDLKRNEDAIRDFTTILEVYNNRYVDAYNNRAFALNCMGRYAAAIDDCDAALRLKPQLAEPRRIRGYAHLKLGSYDQAILDCTDAIRLFGQTYPKALYTRSLAFSAKAKMLAPGMERDELEALAMADAAAAKNACANVADEL